MNTKQLVKNKILLNKVAEYFAKHPKKESVVVKADFGENKVYWRAIREATNRFSITEVKTVTESFIFEIGNAGAQPKAKSKAKAKPAANGLKKTKAPERAKVDASAKKPVRSKNPSANEPVVAEKPLMTIKMVTAQ